MTETVDKQKLREDIAEVYIKEAGQELNFLEKLVVAGVFKKKMKEYLLQDDIVDIDLDAMNFDWLENIIYKVSPRSLDKIFAVLKEKKQALLHAQTQEELENLKADIEGKPRPHPVAGEQEVPDNEEGGNPEQEANNKDADSPDQKIPTDPSLAHTNLSGAAVVVGGPALFKILESPIRINAITKLGGAENAKKSLQDMADMFRDTAKTKAFAGPIAENYKAMAKTLEKTIEGLDNQGLKALDAWEKLGKNPEIARIFALGEADLKIISKLSKSELSKLAGMEVDAIQTFLKNKGLSQVGLELATALKQVAAGKHMTELLIVLQGAGKVGKLAKFVKAIPLLDVLILMTLDRSSYKDLVAQAMLIDNNARRQNAFNRAQLNRNVDVTQAAVSASIGVAALAATLVSAGPPGWVFLAAGATVAGTAEAIKYSTNVLYYKQKDFFLQDRADFLNQYRTEVKQAIVQSVATVYDGRVDVDNDLWTEILFSKNNPNPNLLTAIRYFIDWRRNKNISQGMKTMTADQAREALLINDIVNDNNVQYGYFWQVYSSGLSWKDYQEKGKPDADFIAGYDKDMQAINKQVTMRMECIKPKLPDKKGDGRAKLFIQGKGISYVEDLLKNARWYDSMHSPDAYVEGFTNSQDVDSYKKAYADKLTKENPQAFGQLEKFFDDKQTNSLYSPEYFLELYQSSMLYMAALGNGSGEVDFVRLQEKYAYLQKYYYYRMGSEVQEQKYDIGQISTINVSYSQVKNFLLSLDNAQAVPFVPYYWTKEELVDHVTTDKGMIGNEVLKLHEATREVSDNVGQNIIYSIAKKFHGYTGHNDMLELISYFKEEKKDALGMYYDDGWYVNKNMAKDAFIKDINDFEKLSVQAICDKRFAGQLLRGTSSNADATLNAEYFQEIQSIIQTEKGFHTLEKQAQLVQQAQDYVVHFGTQGYIMLPHTLMRDLYKAKIGDLRDYRFMYDAASKTIRACTWGNKGLSIPKLDFKNISIAYESLDTLRTELSPEEKKCIDYVHVAHTQLTNLTSVTGWMTQQDDLDIPIEIERTISTKWLERQKIEQSLYVYQPAVALKLLHVKYQEYERYFSGLYMGILAKINTHSFENDIDGISDLESVLAFSQVNNIFVYQDNNKKLVLQESFAGCVTGDKQKILDFVLAMPLLQYEGRSIQTLAADPTTRERALWLAQQAIVALWESYMLDIRKDGSIVAIASPGQQLFHSAYNIPGAQELTIQLKGIEKQVPSYHLFQQKYLVDRLLTRFAFAQPISLLDLTKLDANTISTKAPTITTVTKESVQTHSATEKVIQDIEKTMPSVDWRDERGQITFDHTTHMISSRGKQTHIDLEKKRIDGLAIDLSVEQLVWVANLINWFKRYKKMYPNATFDYEWTVKGWGIYNTVGWIDTRLVTQDELNRQYSFILDSQKNVLPAFEHYLNTL